LNPLPKNHNSLNNQALTDTPKNDFAACLAISLQEYPELKQILEAWSSLSKQVKQHILDTVRSVRADSENQ
jgi:hypothetical protein